MRLHGLRGNAMDVDQLVVVAIDEIPVQVEHVGEAAGQAGAEVDAGAAEHHHHAAGHVLAAVVAAAFHHRHRTGIAHREALARGAGGKQLAAGGAVQAGVAHDGALARLEAAVGRRVDHQLAARHALADVVVGVALEIELQPAHVPHAEALPRRALHADRQRVGGHAEVAVAARDLTREPCADGAVIVPHLVEEGAAAPLFDGIAALRHHAFIQQPLSNGGLRGSVQKRGFGRGQAARIEQRLQVETTLARRLARPRLGQVGTTDQLLDAVRAQRRQQLAHLARHEAEVVHHHLGQADEVALRAGSCAAWPRRWRSC